MEYLNIIYKVRARLLALMSVAILLTACSDDTDRSGSLPDDTDVLQIAAYTQDLTSPSQSAATRAVTVPSGYSQYAGSASIGVFMTKSSTTDNSTEMTLISYEDNVWHSLVKVIKDTPYYIYGYMPAYATSTITPNTSFDNGAILKFTNVPSVMSEDFSVITGVLQLQPDNAGNAVQEGTLKAGTFAYTGMESGKNFVDLMFDHLYGALNIELKVAESYNSLRTIKLKELRLRTSDANGPSKNKTNVTVTLNKTEGETPISSVLYEPTGEDVGDLSFFQSALGEELTTSYKPFMGHFMPEGITSFVVTSVYDVYDKNVTAEHPDGNLIRKDCTAENTMELYKLYDRQTVTKRGYKYTIRLTVMPTYLYLLSDPDLDNPTAVIDN